MPSILINYNYEPTWLKGSDLNVRIYDRSDDGVERNLIQYGEVFNTENKGDVDYDKLSYLIDNYDTLPEVFLWGKSNIHKFVDDESLQKALAQHEFVPLLKQDHKTYSDRFGKVNYYAGNMYHERADSWFFHSPDVDRKYFNTWEEWCQHFSIPMLAYIPFAPGGNYILTKTRVHRFAKDFYEDMRSFMPYARRPVEAHCAERSYYLMWR